MEDNIKTLLGKIQEISETKLSVDSISLGKSIDCTPLTFKQQKDLISTVADGASGVIKFQKIVNDIILNNTGNDALTIIDKLPIIIKLRANAIGQFIKIEDTEVDLLEILKKVKSIKLNTTAKISGPVDVELSVPTLLQETKVINALFDSIKNESGVEMGKSIGNIYTYEIVKYISKVKLGDCEVIFADIPIKDRYKIVENLPLSTNKEVIDFIQKNKVAENEALTVNIDGKDKTIDIDVSFFDS